MAADAKVLNQLKHNDPAQRRKAIIALADSRDQAALRPLSDIARLDDDPKLRALALRAQNHLKEQLDRLARQSAAAEGAAPPQPVPVKVSARDVARARTFIDTAMSYSISQNNAKAAENLIKALRINPSLQDDQYYLGVVATVFNTDESTALTMLLDKAKRTDFVKTAKKDRIQKHRTEHRSHTEELGWNSVWFDLIIYGVVIAVITFLAPFVFAQLIDNTLAYQAALSPEKFDAETFKMSDGFGDLTANLRSGGAVPLLMAAVGSGVGNVIFMLLLGWCIHLIATRLLGGNGTMRYMLCQLVPFYSLVTPAFFIWACIVMGLISIGAGMIGALCMPLMGLANLAVFFKAAGKIGSAYDFGSLRGCLSMTLASFALGLVTSLIVYAAFAAMLNSALAMLS